MDRFIRRQFEQPENTMTLDQVKIMGGKLISGLRYLHQKLVVHQDLKPLNIMISRDLNKLKIIDFGVS